MSNEFLELVKSPLMNTHNVIRYSSLYQSREENLSEHICDVMMMSYMITLNLLKFGEVIDVGEVLEKSLIHDVDEVFTGDIVRPTKYYNHDVKQGLDDLACKSIKSIGSEQILDRWLSSKTGKSGFIVKLSDMLCVARKACIEVDLLGNNYFIKVVYEVRNYLKEIIQYLDDHNDQLEFISDSDVYMTNLVIDAISQLDKILSSRTPSKIQIMESYGLDYGVLK